MSMTNTCAISIWTSFLTWMAMIISKCPMRVIGSGDRSGADRTWDRAGAARESAVRFVWPADQHRELRAVFVKHQRRPQVHPSAPLLERRSRSELDQSPHLSRSDSQ